MKEYTTDAPEFSPSIQIIETTDPGHADVVNVSTKQLLQNTLANRNAIGALFGFTYEGNELMNNILGCVRDGEMLIIPAGMCSYDKDSETITLADGYIPSGGGGGGSGYVLPVATSETLGGVKIGAGISSDTDGTISVDTADVTEQVIEEAAAEDSEAEEMLDDVFGSDTEETT